MMSECFEEKYICPAACFSDETGYKCGFGRDMGEGTCPYAPILKLLAEAEEMDKFHIWEPLIFDDGIPWQKVSFWIRR
jgi:hypothetical protein